MACLEMRTGSQWWYGRWTVNKKTEVKNLGIRIAGTRPDSLNQEGDRLFEQSRYRAEAKLKELQEKLNERRHAGELIQTLHRIQTGSRIGSIALKDLAPAWVAFSTANEFSATQLDRAKAILARFFTFMGQHHRSVSDMAGVTHEMAVAFIQDEVARGVAGRTVNATLNTMRSVFEHLRIKAGRLDNPFREIYPRKESTLHRKPFSSVELTALLEAAHTDAFCRPLIITGACTALRLGDVCQLRWSNVDLLERLITVKTSKTDAPVQIPIFPPLYAELSARVRTGEFCFPEQAALYRDNPSGVSYRLQKFFESAGYGESSTTRTKQLPPASEIRRQWAERFPTRANKFLPRVRSTLPLVLEHYLAGKVTGEIMKELNISKGSVSTYLSRIGDILGFSIVRTTREPVILKDSSLAKHEQGKMRVNQRGFHALRTTWVTLALSAGVPIELVRRVTGHTVTETVTKNYFQPGSEQFRQALQAAMPKMLTAGGTPNRDDQMREILTRTSAKTWARDSKQLLELLASR